MQRKKQVYIERSDAWNLTIAAQQHENEENELLILFEEKRSLFWSKATEYNCIKSLGLYAPR